MTLAFEEMKIRHIMEVKEEALCLCYLMTNLTHSL